LFVVYQTFFLVADLSNDLQKRLLQSEDAQAFTQIASVWRLDNEKNSSRAGCSGFGCFDSRFG
jgi:hypothetical protein